MCSTITTVAQWAALGSGGCTIGADTFVFQDFIDFSSGPHSTPTESQIIFTPVIDSNGTGFILTYQTPFQANPTGQADIELIYQVTGPMLTSGYQSITGSATNNAFDQLVDDFCLGVAAPCGSNVDVHVTDTICGATATIPPQGGCDVISNGSSMSFAKTATFASTQTLVGTLKDTGTFGNCPPTNNPPPGCVTGTGTITQVRNQFGGQVPEPSSIILFGTALAAAGIATRYRTPKQS